MTPVLKGFVAVPHGQVHFRYGGSGPVVVMLHDSPRSSVLHAPNIEWLGEHFTVIALDTPGYGNSTPLPQSAPTIKDFAAALAATLGALGIERCALYGFHTGAKIALQFAADHPERVSLAILDGLALPAETATAEYLERYLQPFEPTRRRVLPGATVDPDPRFPSLLSVVRAVGGDATAPAPAGRREPARIRYGRLHGRPALGRRLSRGTVVCRRTRDRVAALADRFHVPRGRRALRLPRRLATTAARPLQRRADPATHGSVAHAVARRAQAGRNASRGRLVTAKAICDARERTGTTALREPDPRTVACHACTVRRAQLPCCCCTTCLAQRLRWGHSPRRSPRTV